MDLLLLMPRGGCAPWDVFCDSITLVTASRFTLLWTVTVVWESIPHILGETRNIKRSPHRGSNLHSVRKIATFLNAPFFWLSGPGCSSSVPSPFSSSTVHATSSGSSCCLIGLALSFGDNLTRFVLVRNLSRGNRFFNIYNLSMNQHENNL